LFIERNSKNILFLFQKKSMSYLESESSREEVEVIFQDWLWWIFQYLPFPHVVRHPSIYQGTALGTC
jgi:hypothetical protein